MKFLTVTALTLFLAVSALSQKMTDLEKLVETERAFARMALEKSTKEAFLHFLADDGIVFEPGPVNGKEVWNKRPPSVGLLSWEPVWADISADGSIGYTTGPWEFRPTGKDGEPVAFGQYVTIWKKQTNGEFRAVLDIGISHGKPEGPPPKLGFPADVTIASQKNIPLVAGAFYRFSDLEGEDRWLPGLAADVRLYRDGELPFIGKDDATGRISTEKQDSKRIFKRGATCESISSFRFCYGVVEMVGGGKPIGTGNYLRVWKSRTLLESPIILDLYTKLPE